LDEQMKEVGTKSMRIYGRGLTHLLTYLLLGAEYFLRS